MGRATRSVVDFHLPVSEDKEYPKTWRIVASFLRFLELNEADERTSRKESVIARFRNFVSVRKAGGPSRGRNPKWPRDRAN